MKYREIKDEDYKRWAKIVLSSVHSELKGIKDRDFKYFTKMVPSSVHCE